MSNENDEIDAVKIAFDKWYNTQGWDQWDYELMQFSAEFVMEFAEHYATSCIEEFKKFTIMDKSPTVASDRTTLIEQPEPEESQERTYTIKDMRAAFYAGRVFEVDEDSPGFDKWIDNHNQT